MKQRSQHVHVTVHFENKLSISDLGISYAIRLQETFQNFGFSVKKMYETL